MHHGLITAQLGRRLLSALALLCVLTVASSYAAAQDESSGLRYSNALNVRVVPIGLSLENRLGYRHKLFDSDHTLLKDAYVEAGAIANISPALLWVGGYLEALPVAFLQLNLNAYYTKYLGTFGFLYVAQDRADPEWSLDDFDRSARNGDGVAASGTIIEATITPRLKIDRVVFFSRLIYSYVNMDVDGPYYEPWYDHLFEPSDHFWVIQPTLGVIAYQDPGESFIMTALRWERAFSSRSDLSRDLLSFVGIWGIPKSWWSTGDPRLAVLTGYWLKHPEDRQGSFFFATQLSMSFGAK